MWFNMRKVGLEFLVQAKRIYTVQAHVNAPRDAVWNALTDPTTWNQWWPSVKSASYGTSPRPYGVGTFREATVGSQRFEEYIVAWDEGRRFAYYIARATTPIASAQLECTDLEDEAVGTRVQWTIAHDPRLLLWLVAPIFSRIMQSMLDKAMTNLEAFLRTDGTWRAASNDRATANAGRSDRRA